MNFYVQTLALLSLCLVSPLAGASKKESQYEGAFSFSVRTNTRAVRFSGEHQEGHHVLATFSEQGLPQQVKVVLPAEGFKTGLSLRDRHLRERVLNDEGVIFEGTANEQHCHEQACQFTGDLLIGESKKSITLNIQTSDQFATITGKWTLALDQQGLEAPSHLGVTVQNEIPIEFELRRK